jgi:hypothetical protein
VKVSASIKAEVLCYGGCQTRPGRKPGRNSQWDGRKDGGNRWFLEQFSERGVL